MATFIGKVQGPRGVATRLGNSKSGMQVTAAGWGGAIETKVYQEDGKDYFVVRLIPWMGSGGESVELASGLLSSTDHRYNTRESRV